ncbi:MAG TPA: LPXTG cell wall anchor domain-containing protein [Gemmatimonadales bacterium]|nr:LPXTG cell wall anchor domain-containing protein [Gemmatimonadales bacterium]
MAGRVVHGGPGERALAGAWVVLHQVSMAGGGQPIDSTRTNAGGAFTFTVTRPDTAVVYVVSSLYAGIAYFSEVAKNPRRRRTSLAPIYVYDTSSTGSGVHVARRVVTVAQRQRDGARAVLELVELANPGSKTQVARDTLKPTWTGALPAGAIQFEVGQGDLSPQTVVRRGDSVAVFAPLPPGASRQLSYAYVLPATARAVTVPIDQPTDEVDLLLEDTTAVVTAAPLDALGIEAVEGRRFARYRVRGAAPGTRLTIALPAAGLEAQGLVPIVAGLVALILGVGFVVALRRKPAPLAPSGTTR